jgi:short chain dehydrogenase
MHTGHRLREIAMLADIAETESSVTRPHARASSSKPARAYLAASGAAAISIVEVDDVATIRTATKPDPRAAVVFWIAGVVTDTTTDVVPFQAGQYPPIRQSRCPKHKPAPLGGYVRRQDKKTAGGQRSRNLIDRQKSDAPSGPPSLSGTATQSNQETFIAKLDGKIALISGGTSGIGAETAKLFQSEGATVVVTGSSERSVEAAKVALSGTDMLVSDAGDVAATKALVDQVKAKHGRIDVLFVNAGIAKFAPIAQVDEAFYDSQFNINVRARSS